MNTKNVINSCYQLPNSVEFKVVSIKSFLAKDVSKRYENILAIKPGYLVAINFRGTLLSNITLEGGVAQLISVEVKGVVISTPKAISQALGVKNDTDFYLLKKIKERVGL